MNKHKLLLSKVFDAVPDKACPYQAVIFLQTDESSEFPFADDQKDSNGSARKGSDTKLNGEPDEFRGFYNFPSQIIGTHGSFLNEIKDDLIYQYGQEIKVRFMVRGSTCSDHSFSSEKSGGSNSISNSESLPLRIHIECSH